MELLPHADFVRVLITMWATWHSRRKALHEQVFQTPHATHHFVISYIRELESLRPKKPLLHSPAIPVACNNRWTPPTQGHVKIKVDGAVSRNSNVGSYGAACRDDIGKDLRASAVHCTGVTGLATLESLTIREDLLLSHVIIASNCNGVVNDI